MEVETRGADLRPRAMEFEDHVSDGVHVQDSLRTSTCTEVTAFSEPVDILVERDSTASALCINTGVDFQKREGQGEELRTVHASCENNRNQSCRTLDGGVNHHQGANDYLNQHHDRRHPSEDINDCIHPSSTTNLCDAPTQCAVAGSSEVTALQITNLGQYACMHVVVAIHTYLTLGLVHIKF